MNEPKRIRGYYQELPDSDKPRPSVTYILNQMVDKPWLRYWYGKVGNSEAGRIGNNAMSFGSAMHKIISDYLTTGTEIDIQSTEMQRSWKLWKEWADRELKEFEPKDSKIEEIIYNEDYAGTCDLFWGARAALFDWKFGNQISDTYLLQMGAYAHLLGAQEGFIIRVSKKQDNIEVLRMDKSELVDAAHAFKSLLPAFKWMEKR